MAFTGNCPNCGNTVEFTAARSIVVVCESCETVVGRAGDALKNYGKVAELVQTSSPLEIGVTGSWRGKPFEIVGRVQMKHASGAVWDEWYAAFDQGERWGWIAEAQNRVTLTFAKRLSAEDANALLMSWEAGSSTTIPSVGKFTIAEVGTATIGFAEGEIPFLVKPGSTYDYADLEGSHGRFATIDLRTTPPTAFVGQRVTYAEIGLERLEDRELVLPTAQTVSVNCQNCGGSLELRAPDASERIICPYCDSLHDVNHGNLKFLTTLKQDPTKPLIPLGAKGVLRGREYTVLGHMRREVVYEGTHYPWDEYLLSTPREPFAWLINAQGHWMLGSAVSAGDVEVGYGNATCAGRSYRRFDKSRPRVIAVHGEFPWKVRFGETVESVDYVSPPYLLSVERSMSLEFSPPASASDGAMASAPAGSWGAAAVQEFENRRSSSEGDEDSPSDTSTNAKKKAPKLPKSSTKKQRKATTEVNYTVSQYLPYKEVQAAFGTPGQMLPLTVAPAQPFGGFSLYISASIALLLIALIYGMLALVFRPTVVAKTEVLALSGPTSEYWSEPFELKAWKNIQVHAKTSSSQVAHFEGGFLNEQTQKVSTFSMTTYGTDTSNKFLSGLPAGTYRLRVRPTLSVHTAANYNLTIDVSQGGVNPTPWLTQMGIALGVLVLTGIIHAGFEHQRWSQSSESGDSS